MANCLRWGALALGLTLPVLAASAQTPAPSADGLRLARQLVEKTSGDRASTMQGMSAPLIGMMQQMGITQPDRAQVMVQEAILPLLNEHYEDLLAMQAKSFASVLSVDDMKAALAFYDTPAGQDFIKAQPQLTQARLTGMTQWIGGLQPEMQSKIQQVLKTHGWDKG